MLWGHRPVGTCVWGLHSASSAWCTLIGSWFSSSETSSTLLSSSLNQSWTLNAVYFTKKVFNFRHNTFSTSIRAFPPSYQEHNSSHFGPESELDDKTLNFNKQHVWWTFIGNSSSGDTRSSINPSLPVPKYYIYFLLYIIYITFDIHLTQ